RADFPHPAYSKTLGSWHARAVLVPTFIISAGRGLAGGRRTTSPPEGGIPVDCDVSGASPDATWRTNSTSGRRIEDSRGGNSSPSYATIRRLRRPFSSPA